MSNVVGHTSRARAIPLALVAALTLVWCQRPAAPVSPAKPNVVVVLVDDARWDDFGFAGHPFVETPAVDRLAREGTRYDLQTDPYELDNLMGTESGNRVLPELQAGLAKLQQDTGYRQDFRGYR